MSARVTVRGAHIGEEFNPAQPVEVLIQLHNDFQNRVREARKDVETIENRLIAAKITLEAYEESEQRYANALETLSLIGAIGVDA